MQMPRARSPETVCMKKADSQASGEIKPEPPAAIEGRDPGVSDEIWAELQHAKKATAQAERQIAREQELAEDRMQEEFARREEELRREMEEQLKHG